MKTSTQHRISFYLISALCLAICLWGWWHFEFPDPMAGFFFIALFVIYWPTSMALCDEIEEAKEKGD